MPNLFEYIEYRKFLSDYYEEQKKFRKFSYQKFADIAGFKTKTFIFKVVTGEKALSKKSIPRIASALQLQKRETKYFDALVRFNDAKTFKDRQTHFDKMQRYAKFSSIRTMRRNQHDLFAKWWHPAIREIACMKPWKEDYLHMGKFLMPAIRPKQAKDSVKLLVNLGIIKKSGNTYKKTENVVSTGNEVRSLAVQNYHREIQKLASEAIDRFPRHTRDISGAVVFVNKETAEKMKSEIQTFRRKLLDMATENQGNDRVYVAQFNFFPLTKIPKRER
ncbi:MAG: TIGR02147 family protein [Fibrobacteres bacterium]|nr:TIGR02147 family protein [Fibrobacterota bacterium]